MKAVSKVILSAAAILLAACTPNNSETAKTPDAGVGGIGQPYASPTEQVRFNNLACPSLNAQYRGRGEHRHHRRHFSRVIRQGYLVFELEGAPAPFVADGSMHNVNGYGPGVSYRAFCMNSELTVEFYQNNRYIGFTKVNETNQRRQIRMLTRSSNHHAIKPMDSYHDRDGD